ncbi:MAG TPA: PilT/PilU family type 4a pilus ATPase, partial [Polyangiales bacterium]|nr:PilT/PilU family type 4a pilus ATPase [Polyangiales bacterium]
LALQADRPPCVLMGEGYTPVLNRNLSEEEVIAALVEAGGRQEVIALVSEARRWVFDQEGVGQVRVSAGYHNGLLQARLRRVQPAAKSTVADRPSARPNAENTGVIQLEGIERNQTPPAAGARPAGLTTTAAYARPAGLAETEPLRTPPAQVSSRPAALTGTAAQRPVALTGTGGQRPAAATGPQRPVADTAPQRPSAPTGSLGPITSTKSLVPEQLTGKPEEMFEDLLKLARNKKASDLHIVADRHAMVRIAGDMTKVGLKLSVEQVEKMLMAQVPAHLKEELARDGAVDFALAHPTLGRFRTNISRQRTGMKLTARPVGDHVPTLAELGLPDAIANATHHHQGLIVVTGPTGHGKTSTMAAIIDVINRERSDHIITVEDPIEYVHPRKKAVISQREVGTHTKKFANALKGSLREDPDVIMVGELRDTETVRMALSASETGHLVISTMNTPSAAKAIERLIDLFPPGDQPQVRMSLSGGLRMITSQRLVPSADRKTVRAAVEILPGSPPLWALIRDNKTFQIPSLQQRGKALGIVRLDDSLADLVRSGFTTLELAREYAEAPDQLEAVVKGAPTKEAPAPANDQAKFGKDMLSKAGKLFGGEK